MSKAIKILVVEDSEQDAELAIGTLRHGGFDAQYERVESASALQAALRRQAWDAVISDFSMPGFSGLDALGIVRAAGLDIPFILISGTIGEETSVAAMKAGASDYLMKGNLTRLAPALERELAETAMRAGHRRAQRDLVESEAGLHRAQIIAKLAHVITRSDGSFESWSETLPQMIGIEPAAVPRSTREWLDIVHPEDRTTFRTNAIEAGRTGARIEFEYRLRRADGSWIHIKQASEPLDSTPDASGKQRWFGTLQDMTAQKRAEAELRESEERFRSLTELSSDFYWETDAGHRLSDTRHGRQHKPVVGAGQRGQTRWDTPSTYPDAAGWAAHRSTLDARQPFRDFEIARIDADGVERHLSLSGEPVIDASGAFKGYRGVGKDITERKQAEYKIRHLNRVYAMLSGINTLIVRVRDREELFREACRIAVDHGKFHTAWIGVVNQALNRVDPAALYGGEPGLIEALRSRDWLEAAEGGNRTAMGRVLAEKKAVFSNDIRADARIRYTNDLTYRGTRSLAVMPLILADSVVAILCLHAAEAGFFDEEEQRLLTELAGDISFALDHIEKEEKVSYLALYDATTGLANRSLFHERLAQHMGGAHREGRKLAVLVIDIERFRTINETLGRQGGDALLKQIAERAARYLTDAKWLARIGADQFASMIPDVATSDGVIRRIEHTMLEVLGAPFRVGDAEVRVGAKIGIALFPDDGADAETLLRNAEAALRKAKASGERYLFYTPEMTARVAEHLALENKLRRALENEEFVLHYQPKVTLDTRRIVGMEALIRWQSPELGLVPPMQFIPLMEETGMILPMGSWALKRASLDHRGWVEMGLKPPRVAVNVSSIQLRQRDFVAVVEHAIVEGVAPTGIDLEITESLIMEDIQANIEKLKSVRGLGVSIAIDDFGTGYSSLAYLAKLPVQTLKIDRSFIITMLNEPDTMTLVSTIVSLAHSLRLKVVAEGVETEEQAKMLRLLRCDEMQGYLFSKPLPLEAITRLLRQPN